MYQNIELRSIQDGITKLIVIDSCFSEEREALFVSFTEIALIGFYAHKNLYVPKNLNLYYNGEQGRRRFNSHYEFWERRLATNTTIRDAKLFLSYSPLLNRVYLKR